MSDENGNFIANIYHHYDGYPEYLGQKLLDIVNKAPLVNGLSGRDTIQYNGFADLAATILFVLKDSEGGGRVYLHTEDDYGQCGEDYLYEIVDSGTTEKPLVIVENMDGEPELVSDVLDRTEELYS